MTAIREKHIGNGHDFVDLGLSVKWAAMNLGAGRISDKRCDCRS